MPISMLKKSKVSKSSKKRIKVLKGAKKSNKK